MKFNPFYILFFCAYLGYSQTDSIQIQLKYEGNSPLIEVEQWFDVLPNSNNNEFYIYAWANAYKDKYTTLSNTKLDSRRDALYFAPIGQRGWIESLHFLTLNGEKIAFSQVDNELYKLIIPKTTERIKFKAEYSIHLPDKKITDYGRDEEGNLLLKYFFLQPAIQNSDGIYHQHFKDFESLSARPTHYHLSINSPERFSVITDLTEVSENNYVGENVDFFQIAVQAPGSTHSIATNYGQVTFGFQLPENDFVFLYPIVNDQMAFLQNFLGPLNEPLFISRKLYRKNKFSGVQDLDIPLIGTYKLFAKEDRLELEMISQLTSAYVDKKIHVDMRNDHWIRNGLKAYLQLKYIEEKFPDLLLSGNLSEDIHLWKIYPLKFFEASKVKMTERTSFLYRLFLTSNLDQAVDTPFDELSNLNQTNVSFYKAGLGMAFLAAYLGEEEFEDLIQKGVAKQYDSTLTVGELQAYLEKNASKDVSWFFDEFIQHESKIDLAIRKIKKTEDSLQIHIKNKTEFNAPIRLTGYKNGEKSYDDWIEKSGKNLKVSIPRDEYDLIVLNDSIEFPDFNLKNNYYKPNSIFRRKLKFGLVTDIPSYEHDQIFIFPEFEWNNYDKFQLGVSLSNKTILPQPWIFKIKPQYSTGENALTGSFNTSYRIYPDNGWFRQIQFSFNSSYQHYDQGLAYKSYGLGGSFVFDKSPRDLISRSIITSYQHIDRELALDATPEEIELKDYKLYNLGYQYWEPGIIHEKKILLNFQVSNNFSKIFGEVYWRWKFAENKRLTVRVFGGTFINQKLENTDYFDFGLDRISDYTFSYPLLGRSEETGLLSQQFVLAEGGFKSNFFVYANQYMYTLNLEYPVWKMFDLYGDAGIYKSKMQPTQFVYDTGVRVRVIPDFLELYFPIQSTLGFEPTLGAYHERIRFMLNLDFGKVIQYWRRGRY